MKKILLLAVVMSVCLTASAQQPQGTWSLTPKVGFNFANLAGDINDNSMKFALTIGADAMYQVSPTIGISGGLFYSRQGCEFSGDRSSGLNMLNIPILANFYVYKGLALKTGLQPGFILSANFKNGDTTTNLPCLHMFHTNCIQSWLRTQNTCPICKFKLTQDNINNINRRG